MCWKRKPEIVTFEPVKRRLITVSRNKYGGSSDLKGCLNDAYNWDGKAKAMQPDFDVKMALDYDATGNRYLDYMRSALRVTKPGATVLILADSCFSETLTRGTAQMNIKHVTKNRFIDPGLVPRQVTNKIFRSGPVMDHIMMSACLATETASDAYINKNWAGAFTFFAIMALQPGMTYLQWYAAIRKFLPSADFTQTPTIEGPDYLLDRKVFEDDTLIIHNSSHGSYVYDKSGDEADGQDETIYFDRHVVDDEIKEVLKEIPKI